jgi:ABC-type glycerol-3-phosphate transport system permease component
MDGANDFTILFRIFIPLTKPVIALLRCFLLCPTERMV